MTVGGMFSGNGISVIHPKITHALYNTGWLKKEL